jgi:DNA-binding transcriptional ArsR family regulator
MGDLCKEINKFGKGIGNETRYRILESLIKGKKTVSELVSEFDLTQSAISQHLRTLRESNLVIDERQGQEVYYSVNSEYTLKLLTSLVKDMEKSRKNNEK